MSHCYLQRRTPQVLFQEVSVTGRGSQPSSPTQVTDLIASSVVQGSLADVSPATLGLVPSTSEGPPPVPEFCRRKKVQTFRHLAPPPMDSLPSEIPRCLQPQNWGLLSPCVLCPVSCLSSILTYQQAWRIFYQFRNAIFHSVCKAFPIVPHKHWLFLLLICTTKSMLRLL